MLFISEFLMIKTMIVEKHYWLCALFVILLTIVLYGMGKVVFKMAFRELSKDKLKVVEKNKTKLSFAMYLPQIVMLILVFVLGLYMPPILENIINLAFIGF